MKHYLSTHELDLILESSTSAQSVFKAKKIIGWPALRFDETTKVYYLIS
jgi:hypothetical protein